MAWKHVRRSGASENESYTVDPIDGEASDPGSSESLAPENGQNLENGGQHTTVVGRVVVSGEW